MTLEFSRDRKSMGVFASSVDGKDQKIYVKGAPEKVLERCTSVRLADGTSVKLDAKLHASIDASLTELSGGKFTYRCLGLATVDNPAPLSKIVEGLNAGKNSVDFEVNILMYF